MSDNCFLVPESSPRIEEQIARDGLWEGELVHTCRDGRLVTVESRWSAVRDASGHVSAVLEVNRDITRRRQLEQTQHAETVARLAFFQQLIDALPSSIYLVYGHDACLLFANRAAQSVWGARWLPDQAMGVFLESFGIANAQGLPMPLSELVTPRAARQHETVRQLQEIILRPNQTSLPVLANAVALEASQGWQLLRPGTEPHYCLPLGVLLGALHPLRSICRWSPGNE
ncbi:MAG TPA: PAS domain-containing protein [Ktedonobacteraceae bacterium]|nr:PAS domain-containing protein [Ktedonobacteraceae bacterium]